MTGRRVVIKVGGSVLGDEPAYASVASVLADYLRRSPALERLYIVVSAQKGMTDRALEALAPDPENRRHLLARLAGQPAGDGGLERWDRPRHALALLWGEIDSAFHLAECLHLEGCAACVVTQLGLYPIVSRGPYLRAELDLALSRRRFRRFERAHRQSRIIILPGFGAANVRGEPTLFGRNASDYVAAILSALDPNVNLVIFLKDVGAIYEASVTGGQRKIAVTDIARLRAGEFGRVLDRRVLEIIPCEFHVVGPDMRAGGTVVLPARAS
jgi:aspartokinase